MKIIILALLILFACALIIPANSANFRIMFSWEENTESDLQGYKIYHRKASDPNQNYIFSRAFTRAIGAIPIETDEIVYFVLTAYDQYNNESLPSKEIIFDPNF